MASARKLIKAATLNNSTLYDFMHPAADTQQEGHSQTPSKKRKQTSPPRIDHIDTTNPDLNSVSSGINSIISQLKNITDTQNLHTEIMSQLKNKVTHNSSSISTLQNSSNFLQQSRLNDRIEITGMNKIVCTNKNDFRQMVCNKFHEWKIDVEKVEIADAYSQNIKLRNGEEKYVVTVIFIHEGVKIRVMKAKAQIGSAIRGIYFNEVLSAHNRKLIFHARAMKKAGKFIKVGTLNGRVYVKMIDGDDQKIFVDSILEMEELAKINLKKTVSDGKNNTA